MTLQKIKKGKNTANITLSWGKKFYKFWFRQETSIHTYVRNLHFYIIARCMYRYITVFILNLHQICRIPTAVTKLHSRAFQGLFQRVIIQIERFIFFLKEWKTKNLKTKKKWKKHFFFSRAGGQIKGQTSLFKGFSRNQVRVRTCISFTADFPFSSKCPYH